MEYRRLGASNLEVSKICLGCMSFGSSNWRSWVLDEKESIRIIHSAYELGINFFDTADVYSNGKSEEILGKALSNYSRDSFIIATKVGLPFQGKVTSGLSKEHIASSIDESLQRLKIDYIDLLQIHRFDPNTPIDETILALESLVQAGKVRYIGASSMYQNQFEELINCQRVHSTNTFASMQLQYNLIYREEKNEMIPFCTKNQIGILVWSPLARGFLAGKNNVNGTLTKRVSTDGLTQKMYYNENDFEILEKLDGISRETGESMAKISLNWILRQPEITSTIVGVRNLKYLKEAIAADNIEISEQKLLELNDAYKKHRIEFGVEIQKHE